LNLLKLIPQPERFTELYFENASALPRATVARQTASFAFTIRNFENATTAYPYEVYFEYPNGERIGFATGTVVLANNASLTIAVSHMFPSSNLHGSVVVDLPSQGGQSIDFLLPDENQ
jgi:hypothetical protein